MLEAIDASPVEWVTLGLALLAAIWARAAAKHAGLIERREASRHSATMEECERIREEAEGSRKEVGDLTQGIRELRSTANGGVVEVARAQKIGERVLARMDETEASAANRHKETLAAVRKAARPARAPRTASPRKKGGDAKKADGGKPAE